MMARSKSSNQRPDTLMQDRNRQLDENLLQRAAGPYMWVIFGCSSRLLSPLYVRFSTKADLRLTASSAVSIKRKSISEIPDGARAAPA